MHAVAVIFDFMQPLVAVRCFFHELRQLRPHPLREAGSSPCLGRSSDRPGRQGLGQPSGRPKIAP